MNETVSEKGTYQIVKFLGYTYHIETLNLSHQSPSRNENDMRESGVEKRSLRIHLR
jgi:hypothetical protein